MNGICAPVESVMVPTNCPPAVTETPVATETLVRYIVRDPEEAIVQPVCGAVPENEAAYVTPPKVRVMPITFVLATPMFVNRKVATVPFEAGAWSGVSLLQKIAMPTVPKVGFVPL